MSEVLDAIASRDRSVETIVWLMVIDPVTKKPFQWRVKGILSFPDTTLIEFVTDVARFYVSAIFVDNDNNPLNDAAPEQFRVIVSLATGKGDMYPFEW